MKAIARILRCVHVKQRDARKSPVHLVIFERLKHFISHLEDWNVDKSVRDRKIVRDRFADDPVKKPQSGLDDDSLEKRGTTSRCFT